MPQKEFETYIYCKLAPFWKELRSLLGNPSQKIHLSFYERGISPEFCSGGYLVIRSREASGPKSIPRASEELYSLLSDLAWEDWYPVDDYYVSIDHNYSYAKVNINKFLELSSHELIYLEQQAEHDHS